MTDAPHADQKNSSCPAGSSCDWWPVEALDEHLLRAHTAPELIGSIVVMNAEVDRLRAELAAARCACYPHPADHETDCPRAAVIAPSA